MVANATRTARRINTHAQCWLVTAQCVVTEQRSLVDPTHDPNAPLKQHITTFNDIIYSSPVEYLVELTNKFDSALILMAIPVTYEEAERARALLQPAATVTPAAAEEAAAPAVVPTQIGMEKEPETAI